MKKEGHSHDSLIIQQGKEMTVYQFFYEHSCLRWDIFVIITNDKKTAFLDKRKTFATII